MGPHTAVMGPCAAVMGPRAPVMELRSVPAKQTFWQVRIRVRSCQIVLLAGDLLLRGGRKGQSKHTGQCV
jgi:hypothetical protein